MTPKRWTWPDVENIRALRASGMSMQKIAKKYQRSRNRIWQVLKIAELYPERYAPQRMSTRLANCLKNNGCQTLEQAAQISLADWLYQPNFSKVCAIELADLLGNRLDHKDLGILARCLRARNAEMKRRQRANA